MASHLALTNTIFHYKICFETLQVRKGMQPAADLNSWNGQDLQKMFRSASRVLRRNGQAINALNVFPIPDGDTGTNMLLTLEAALERANLCSDNKLSDVAQSIAEGALMGARGNSGVILSQILHGLAQELAEKEAFSGKDLARALLRSTELAYKGITEPVEGTMLTVLREASSAANSMASYSGDLQKVLQIAAEEARDSVARTPQLLPILRESGVVDAGGQGLWVIFDGILRFLRGEEMAEEPEVSVPAAAGRLSEESRYGYCTEFLLQGEKLNPEEIRRNLTQKGESVLVAGNENLVRVHLHTLDPGATISYGTKLGILKQVKIENMDEQHRNFLTGKTLPLATISMVAVASGEGLVQILESFGAMVVPGSESMNPSVKEVLHGVESAPTHEVIILPNNPDVLPVTHQVQSLSQKLIKVVPSRTIPQGIAAVLSFDPEKELEANVEAMQKNLSSVRTGEISTAVRSMKYKGLKVEGGQIIGFVDGELVAAGENKKQVLQQLLPRMEVEKCELLTLYYGSKVYPTEVEELASLVRQEYPHLQLEILLGGQPHYDYIISVE